MTMTGIWQTLVRVESHGIRADAGSWAALRTFVVPPDIIPVQRRSPVRVRKRTPWHPHPDGHATERPGAREWFSDRVFVEPELGHSRACRTASAALHTACVMVVVAVLVARSDQMPRVRVGPPLVMPAMMAMMPVGEMLSLASESPKQAAPSPMRQRPAVAPSPAPAAGVAPAAPVEAPSSIAPETGAEGDADGGEAGVPGGIGGGVLDGTLSSRAPSPGPMRLADGIERPRKIKDVKPVYPQAALSDKARGTVIIEATIGIDGKVQDTRVLHSVPLLDQAALDAVRQWEYAPSLLNGVPVAVIMTIVVNFAIQ